MKQTCILVLGMHRSGTSALTGVLQWLDIELGSKLGQASEDNQKGFFENTFIVEFNEKILNKMNSSWDDIFFNFDSMKDQITYDEKEELKSILLKEFSNSKLFAIKDPRICYLFPLYEEVLNKLNIDIKVLIPYRNPQEVIKSLQKRNNFKPEKSLMLWMSYFFHAENYSRKYKRSFLKFDDLINNAEFVITSVDQLLELNLSNYYKKNKIHIESFLEKSLKHQNMLQIEFPNIFNKLLKKLEILNFDSLTHIDNSIFEILYVDYFELLRYLNSAFVDDYKINVKNINTDIVQKQERIIKLQNELQAQSKWAKDLDEKNKEKESRIVQLQEAIEKQTTWAKELDEKNKQKEERIILLINELSKLKEEFEILKIEKEKLKRNNNLMFARLKKLESFRVFRLLERFINLSQEPKQIIVKKLIKKLIPNVIPKLIQRKEKIKILKELINTSNEKVLIVFPIIAWGFRWQRPQHMISRLAKKGYTVIYVAKDFNFYKTTAVERESILEHIQFKKLDDNIYKIYLNSLTSLNIYKDTLDKHNVHWFMLQIKFLLENFKNKEFIYYVQFPNWLNVVKTIEKQNKGKIVFDCMDEHSGFSNVDQQIIEHEIELIKMADMVISSSNKLFDKNILHNSNTVKIKNGTEFEFFNTKQNTDELQDISNKPIIGYYGAIADWFDIELIEYCAKQRPEYNFVLIGSTFSCNIENAKILSNIFFLGEKNYKDLPKYLYSFDVCTIPFKIIPLIEATNPVKFYEYISAGKPVVSTKLPELEEFKDICYLAKDKEEFLNMLDMAVKEKELDDFEQLVQKRIQIAKENSWDSRVTFLEDKLEELI